MHKKHEFKVKIITVVQTNFKIKVFFPATLLPEECFMTLEIMKILIGVVIG